jgi:hypothetical protein
LNEVLQHKAVTHTKCQKVQYKQLTTEHRVSTKKLRNRDCVRRDVLCNEPIVKTSTEILLDGYFKGLPISITNINTLNFEKKFVV